jgi:hypothetical protein
LLGELGEVHILVSSEVVWDSGGGNHFVQRERERDCVSVGLGEERTMVFLWLVWIL